MLRIGVIGVGHMGWLHARNLKAMPACRLTALLDPDSARTARAALEFDARVVGDLDTLAGACDAVVVAAPTSEHHILVTECLARGLHVFVEKPLAATPAEGAALATRAEAGDRVLAVGHVERFNPAFRAVADRIESPLFVEAHRLAPFVPRSIDVDVVTDLMIHDIDLLLAVHASATSRVDASGVPVLTGKEDIANARIAFEDGAVANLTASRVSRERLRRIRFFVPRAYVSIDLLKRAAEVLELAADPREWLARGELPPAGALIARRTVGPFPDANPLADEVADFVAACVGDASPLVGVRDGLRALELAARVQDEVRDHLLKIRSRR